jgi:hypothetical protein
MSYGFKIWDAGGVQRLSSDDFAGNIVDVFEVSPASSGSKTYEGMANYQLIVSQTPVEPTTIDTASLISFNSVNTSVSNSGSNKILSWSPRYSYGNAYNVTLYVLVL